MWNSNNRAGWDKHLWAARYQDPTSMQGNPPPPPTLAQTTCTCPGPLTGNPDLDTTCRAVIGGPNNRIKIGGLAPPCISMRRWHPHLHNGSHHCGSHSSGLLQ